MLVQDIKLNGMVAKTIRKIDREIVAKALFPTVNVIIHLTLVIMETMSVSQKPQEDEAKVLVGGK